MAIDIAVGILLGILFTIIALAVALGITMVVAGLVTDTKKKKKSKEIIEPALHKPARKKVSKYEETQRLKERAKRTNPTIWRE